MKIGDKVKFINLETTGATPFQIEYAERYLSLEGEYTINRVVKNTKIGDFVELREIPNVEFFANMFYTI